MSTWLPGVARDESIYGAGGGSMTGGPSKIVLHSTEGSWDGSMSVFRSRLTAPHVLADPKARRILQLIPLDRSGYSLRNESGGVQTNTDGVLQVEIVMFAAHAHELTDEQLDWLGTAVVGPLARHAVSPVDLAKIVPFLAYPASYGDSPARMTQAAWDAFNGVCGHQHVPENDHGDPGAIDIARILAAARGTTSNPTPMEDDMILQLEGEPALFIGGLPHTVPGPLVKAYVKGRETGIVDLPKSTAGRQHYEKVAALVKANN